jgi:hypothetical protein
MSTVPRRWDALSRLVVQSVDGMRDSLRRTMPRRIGVGCASRTSDAARNSSMRSRSGRFFVAGYPSWCGGSSR